MHPAARVGAAGLVAVTATLSGTVLYFEGNETKPYRDVTGTWTVCGGVTGAHIIPNKEYTLRECYDLNRGALAAHGAGVRKCIGDQHLTQVRYEAITSLAYNVGVGAVCNGSIPRLLKAGQPDAACDRIMLYDKVRVDGVLVSCQDPRWNCRGVWLRRQAETAWCKGTPPPIPSLGVVG